jgi:hypothetical protein
MENTALTTTRENPAELMRQSTDVAGVCREIVEKTATTIQGKQYVCVEGWTSIAGAHGCVAGTEEPVLVEGGIQAKGYVKRIADGMVLTTGYGFVGDDEKTWANRDEYARRAMAQTRAISRACRMAFSHVVTLMDAKLETTPMEEVPEGGFENAKPVNVKPAQTTTPKQPVNRVIKAEQPKAASTDIMEMTVRGAWSTYEITFGKYKGVALGQIATDDPDYMNWLANKRTPNLRDDGSDWPSDIELKKHLEEWKGEINAGLQKVKDVVDQAGNKDDDVPF